MTLRGHERQKGINGKHLLPRKASEARGDVVICARVPSQVVDEIVDSVRDRHGVEVLEVPDHIRREQEPPGIGRDCGEGGRFVGNIVGADCRPRLRAEPEEAPYEELTLFAVNEITGIWAPGAFERTPNDVNHLFLRHDLPVPDFRLPRHHGARAVSQTVPRSIEDGGRVACGKQQGHFGLEGEVIRASLRIATIAALVGIGWIAAKAQTSEPNFEIVVIAPDGETTIECVRGCELSWVERGLNPASATMKTFTFKCSGSAGGQCSSRRVGGWIKP